MDTTPPSKPSVTDDGAYTLSTTTLHATWASADGQSGIAEYQYQIQRDSTSGAVLVPWASTGTTKGVTRTGLSLISGKKYFFAVTARNGDGLWSAIGYSNGITVDTSPPSAPGTPKEGGSTDLDFDADGKYAVTWTAATDGQSGIAAYELQERVGASGGWATLTNSKTARSFTVSNRQDGLTYFYQVRAKNGVGLWGSFSPVSDGIRVDKTPPPAPAVTDDGAFIGVTTQLHATWSAADPESGIAEYQYRIVRDSPTGSAVTGWTVIGTATSVTRTGLSLLQGVTYYVLVKAKNGAGTWSAVGNSDGITVDTTPPTAPAVTDDGATTSSTTQLHASWTAATDPESGIAEYQYQIRRDTPTGALIRDWTSAGVVTDLTATSLSLIVGKTYFIGVRAKNGAGLFASPSFSDGIQVVAGPDTTPPVISPIGITGITPTSATLNWTTDELTFCHVAYGTTSTYGQMTAPNTMAETSYSVILSGLSEFTEYHARVVCHDVANNQAQSADQAFDTTADAPLGADPLDVEGIIFASWWQDEYASPTARQSLLKLAKTGADYVGILGTWYMSTTCTDGEASKSNDIFAHPQKTPTDEALRQAIRWAKALGRQVFLKLHVRVILNDTDGDPQCDPTIPGWKDAWAGRVAPSNSSQWFSSYQAFAIHYAQIAQAEDVDILAFGTELPSMTEPQHATQWDAIINAIKAVYMGKLTFSSNIPNEFNQITFWDRCDYLGIGPYYSLNPPSPPSPGLDAIVDGWQNSPDAGDLLQLFSQWSAQHGGKPIIFTELGYTSVDTATFKPWKGISDLFGAPLPENQPLQKRACDALLLRLQKEPWFAGIFWWDWLTNPDAGTVGLERKEYTPQNKPAEQSLKNFFLGVPLSQIASVKIVDGDGVEFANGTQVAVGRHANLYAAGRDATDALLGFIPATWTVSGSGGTVASNDVGFARVNATAEGTLQVTATANGRSDSVTLTAIFDALRVPSEFATIQAAASAAQSGDTILVAPGTYAGGITLPAGVTLRSEFGASSTIIDATGSSFGVTGGERVEGFTIRNANGPGVRRDPSAGGINTTKNILHNIIEMNRYGIELYDGDGILIANNIIRNNTTTEHGAGIRLDGGIGAVVVNNVVIGNRATNFNSQGGGIYVSSSPAVVLRNNIVIRNTADLGGGIRVYNSTGITVDYNDVWSNSGRAGFENYYGVTPGPGSISVDPKFVNETGGDYHLQADSPCINTGHPDPAYNDVNGTRNDMGAYGGPQGNW